MNTPEIQVRDTSCVTCATCVTCGLTAALAATLVGGVIMG